MQLKNEFGVDVPAEQAWPLLLDVASVVQCVPGAELLEKLDDRSFKGRVSVKLGPVLLAFEGVAKFEEIDAVIHRARVSARGADKKGRGSAIATVTMQVAPNGGSSKVTAVTDLQLSGSVAQYGRASGLIAGVSKQLVDDFAKNLNRRITDAATPAASTAAPEAHTAHESAKPISGFGFIVRLLSRSLARIFRVGKSRT